MIRGQPRIGYELNIKVELNGVENTYFQDFVCEVDIEELCDDGGEPDSAKVSMTKMLDTN